MMKLPVNEAFLAPPRASALPRLQFLDSLRGLAAVWVCLFHIVLIPVPNLAVPAWAWLATVGGLGVTLFFVVSAFSLCHTAPLHKSDPKPLLAFYLRRFFRIAPLFYAVLLFYYWRDLHLYGNLHGADAVALSVFFVFNLVPGFQEGIVWASWTIGVEMLFYLAFPLLWRRVDGIWKAVSLFFMCVLLARLTLFVLGYFSIDQAKYFTFTILRYLPIFALGILAFHVGHALRRRAPAAPAGVALITLALVGLFTMSERPLPILSADQYSGLIIAIFVVGLMLHPTAIFVNRVTAFLGQISYSLYLLHPSLVLFLIPVYRQIYDLPVSVSLKFAGSVAVTFAILVPLSYATYRWIERPGIDLGKRLLAVRGRKVALHPANAL